jgi:predicted GH43/DUF377 family glycosyl hydrolase
LILGSRNRENSVGSTENGNTKILKNIVQRWEGNPVISIRELPFQASDIHNAGAVKHNGEYILLVTIENLRGDCAIYLARSKQGKRFEVEETPFLASAVDEPFATYESQGVRDPRITRFDGAYYIVYLAQSPHGVRLALAKTRNFRSVKRVALISEPDTKNGLLFPRKIGGKYARLERPAEGGSIWISYSDDLIHWGGWELVMTPRGGFWDSHRIGAAVPPMETECGWLLIYYGERELPGGPLFRLGVAFLDRENPAEVIGRSNIPVLAPYLRYERVGDAGNLVFSCGAVLSDDDSQVEIYYGAADSCICLGMVDVADLQKACFAARAKGEA